MKIIKRIGVFLGVVLKIAVLRLYYVQDNIQTAGVVLFFLVEMVNKGF